MEPGTLEKKIAGLPENLKIEVEHFIDNLTKTQLNEMNAAPEIKAGFGGGKGLIIYMSDDFDAPLEDFKDYM